MSPDTLVLDLDGTLVDTAHDLVGTLNAVLAAQGHDELPFDVARDTVGHGARHMIQRAYAVSGRAIDDEHLGKLTRDFFAHYAGRIAQESRPFPGSLAALDRFAAAGWRLAICTNKNQAPAVDLLRALGLADRFAAICGQDTFGFAKPDPRHLTETVRAAGGEPNRAIMVGDSVIDIHAAQAARMPVVAVTFGYSATSVADFAPDATIDHFDELWGTVAAL